MRALIFILIAFCLCGGGVEARRFQGAKRLTLNDARWRRQGSCASRGQGNASVPAHISADECCDGRLDSILRQETDDSSKLGDTARTVQRRVQQVLGHSYEVIISKGDFSVSSHYHGQRICKVRHGDYHILAYETPVPYNQNDATQEELLASVDAQEQLGSTLPENLRGRFPDVRFDATAGEQLGEQPPPELARAGGGGGTAALVKFGNQTSLRQGEDIGSAEGLPEGTHCDSSQSGGSRCCSGSLFATMNDAVRELSTSPSFGGSSTPGVAANLIKTKVQQRFERVFEVIVSESDFEYASHMVGDFTCKFRSHGYTVLAYETPHNSAYDPYDETEEARFSSLSDDDPLGTSDSSLPGQRMLSHSLALEAEGDRAGFAKGSHCGDSRLGSRCCNLPLFDSMHSTMRNLLRSDEFNHYDRRAIARELRDAAENAIGESMETIVSKDDFVVSSYGDDVMCKFRMEGFYVMAWKTPVPYPLHDDQYADNGHTSIIGCSREVRSLEGATCCSGELRYTMTKAMDEANRHNYTKVNTDAVSRAIVRAAQMRFHKRFETVVSRGDFVWNSPGHMGANVCKLDLVDFHALTFQSSEVVPSPDEFLFGDVVPSEAVQPFGNEIGQAVPQFQQQQVFIQNAQSQPQQVFVQNAQPQQVFIQNAQPQQAFVQNAQPAQQFFAQNAQPQFIAQQQVVPPVQQGFASNYYYSGYGYGGGGVGAGGGGGGGACFSEDTWVTTPTGKKNMAMLQLGDYVLTANTTAPYFAQVTVWMHRDPEKLASFTTIMTDYGKMLRLTPKHLVFRNLCDDDYAEYIETLPASGEEVFAHELKKGDCMILLYKGKWRQQRIKEITKTKRKGIYAPLTTNGRILVNDILASCYSDVKGPTLQTSYFEIVSFIRQRYYDLTGFFAGSTIELPFSTDLWKDLLSLILP